MPSGPPPSLLPRGRAWFATLVLLGGSATSALACEALVGIEEVRAAQPGEIGGSPACVMCDGICRAVQTVERCGSCGNACADGQACLGGVCDRSMRAGSGAKTMCLRDARGALVCRGANEFGQLGRGTVTSGEAAWAPPLLGGDPGSFAAAGGDVTCYRLGTGELLCAGTNSRGGLGVSGGDSGGVALGPTGPLGSIRDLAAGPTSLVSSPVCAVTFAEGAFCWGLGRKTANEGPMRMDLGAARIAQVEVGAGFACFLDEGGTVRCLGVVGEPAPSPAEELRVLAAPPARAIAAGALSACIVDGEGAVRCWGSTRWGQLGEGTITDRTSAVPAPIGGRLANPITQIVGGTGHFCALDRAGSVLCWGDARSVGDGLGSGLPCGGGACRPLPERVPLADIVELAAASGVTFARRRDGALFAWGVSSASECLLGDVCEDTTWLLPRRIELP